MLTPKIESVECEKPYFLILKYENGEKFLFDVEPYISGNWYSQLESWDYFTQVKITEDGYGIEWPTGQDIAPHELYNNSEPAQPVFHSSLSLENIEYNFQNERFYDNVAQALKEVAEIEKIEKIDDELWRIKRKGGK